MRKAGTRVLINFAVDSAIAVAFVLCAASGLVFLLPAGWSSLLGGPTSALGVGFATWRALHDWTAIAMIAGVTLHTALHWRWIMTMARRLAGVGGRRTAAAVAGRPATSGPNAVVRTSVDTCSRASAACGSATHVHADRDLSVSERVERRVFLTRAGVVAAAALAGGLVGRSAASAASSWLAAVASRQTPPAGGGPQGASGDRAQSGTADAPVVAGSGGSEGALEPTDPTLARVSIDATRCTGCGACVQACPYGVFTSDGRAVVVADASRCRLCGRCAQVCRAAAITLGA